MVASQVLSRFSKPLFVQSCFSFSWQPQEVQAFIVLVSQKRETRLREVTESLWDHTVNDQLETYFVYDA
jgi:hypothetical protein